MKKVLLLFLFILSCNYRNIKKMFNSQNATGKINEDDKDDKFANFGFKRFKKDNQKRINQNNLSETSIKSEFIFSNKNIKSGFFKGKDLDGWMNNTFTKSKGFAKPMFKTYDFNLNHEDLLDFEYTGDFNEDDQFYEAFENDIEKIDDKQIKECYKELEIDEKSTAKEVKKAFRKLAVKWHPDKNPENVEEATNKFAKIYKAYEILQKKLSETNNSNGSVN